MKKPGKKARAAAVAQAKAKLGAAITHAIEGRPRRLYGHEGLMSGVCAGTKLPTYLAAIYLNPDARRRFALALLTSDERVKVRTVVECDFEEDM